MARRLVGLPLVCLLAAVGPAAAQSWNDSIAQALVARAVARRAADPARGLRDFQARAHGFLFFLAQVGADGLDEPPRLVKSDQLELEVYWRAPGASKQRIIGWRDRTDLPTDIQYHRDHLGIVQNGFADRIRLGEGDEVRDVPHPLAPDGPARYDFALVDSLSVFLPERTVRVLELAFRPREPDEPRIAGTCYLDAEGGELVQLRFSFTRAAYLDPSLEDITVVLENGLWEGRYWLPRRQEIEIRRRSTWLDVPARGIIRARWDIDGYRFDTGIADNVFLGPEIVSSRTARDSFPWPEPLADAVTRAVGPQRGLRLGDVRQQVGRMMRGHPLSGLRAAGLAASSLSDLAHVNRVEGLTLGLGAFVRPRGGAVALRGWAAYGFSAERPTGGASVTVTGPSRVLRLSGARAVEDIGDVPPIARAVNSLTAQELGDDYGDYVLVDRLLAEAGLGPVTARGGVEWRKGIDVAATPAAGSYRPNPDLGAGRRLIVGVETRARFGGAGRVTGVARLGAEGLIGADSAALRVMGWGNLVAPVGAGEVALEGYGAWASPLAPAARAVVLGGRGSVPGEPFRAYGGRTGAWARLEWRIAVPFVAIPLGRFASTGRSLVVAPFLAAGWADQPIPRTPWAASDGVRPSVGLAVELFHRMLRIESGWAPRADRFGVTVDVRRDLWPIL